MTNFELCGLDHTLEHTSVFFTCLPVLREGDKFARVLSFEWSAEQGIIRGLSQHDIEGMCERLSLASPVVVPEGYIVAVMGTVLAQNLAVLKVPLEADWTVVQSEFRVALVSPDEADRRRQIYAEEARGILTAELGRALRERADEGYACEPTKRLSLTAKAAHAVAMNVAYGDRLEIALLDLVFLDLIGDGGVKYQRSLGLYAARLQRSVEWLRMNVEARIAHLMRDKAKAPRRIERPRVIVPAPERPSRGSAPPLNEGVSPVVKNPFIN